MTDEEVEAVARAMAQKQLQDPARLLVRMSFPRGSPQEYFHSLARAAIGALDAYRKEKA